MSMGQRLQLEMLAHFLSCNLTFAVKVVKFHGKYYHIKELVVETLGLVATGLAGVLSLVVLAIALLGHADSSEFRAAATMLALMVVLAYVAAAFMIKPASQSVQPAIQRTCWTDDAHTRTDFGPDCRQVKTIEEAEALLGYPEKMGVTCYYSNDRSTAFLYQHGWHTPCDYGVLMAGK